MQLSVLFSSIQNRISCANNLTFPSYNELSGKKSAKWNYCRCILIDEALGPLNKKLHRHESVENKTFPPGKERMKNVNSIHKSQCVILFLSANVISLFC